MPNSPLAPSICAIATSLALGIGRPIGLRAGLAFLPLDEDDLDALSADRGETFDGFASLGPLLGSRLQAISDGGDLVYLETEYFGGVGGQGAVRFAQGAVAFGPSHSGAAGSGEPINAALAGLGVRVEPPARDEFDTVGLGAHRSNEAFRAAAPLAAPAAAR